MRKICSVLALFILVASICSCGSQPQPVSSESQTQSEINLSDFTDVVVWDQGLDKTFDRFTRYVLDQYIVQNTCSVSRQKEDGNYRIIMDGGETDCTISFKGNPSSREINQIIVDSPCDTDTNTDAFFVAGGSMLSACFDKKYSAEYGMKYFCRMVGDITNEEPMQVEQFGDTKVSATSSNVGINLCIQRVTGSASDSGSSKSGNEKAMEAWKNRNNDSSAGTGGNGYGGSSLSEIYQRGKVEDETSADYAQDNATQNIPLWDREESEVISNLRAIISDQAILPGMSISLRSVPYENGNLYLAEVNGSSTGVGYSYLSDTDLGKDNLTLLSTNALDGNDAEAFAVLADAMIVESDPSGQYSTLVDASHLLERLIDNATANKGSSEEVVSNVKYKLVISSSASIFIVKPAQ